MGRAAFRDGINPRGERRFANLIHENAVEEYRGRWYGSRRIGPTQIGLNMQTSSPVHARMLERLRCT